MKTTFITKFRPVLATIFSFFYSFAGNQFKLSFYYRQTLLWGEIPPSPENLKQAVRFSAAGGLGGTVSLSMGSLHKALKKIL